MLHILNGDATADLLAQSGLPGQLFPWREALACGPAPGNRSPAQWLNMRAAYLAHSSDQNVASCKRQLQKQQNALHSLHEHDKIILWFEFDLFCQINLIYLLAWLQHHKPADCSLYLICIDSFPGIENFRGFGQLSPAQLASLFDRKTGITPSVLQLGATAWQAYSAPEPTAIEKLLRQDTSDLPCLAPALEAHLRRFPSTQNGLGALENRILELLAGGIDEFVPLFRMICDLDPIYGFGDLQIWESLIYLSRQNQPVLHLQSEIRGETATLYERMVNTSLTLTDFGRRVHTAEADFLQGNAVDVWLGGVHLQRAAGMWRWDSTVGRGVKIVDL